MNYKLPEFSFDFEQMQKFLESNILLYCVVLLLILKICTVAVYSNLPFNIFFADITKATLVDYVNQTRQSMGLGTLTNNPKLDQAAQLKAEDMVRNQYFEHVSPNGITPWFWFAKTGYDYKYAGENLAIGFYDSAEVYNAWLNSPSHKANLLNPNYKEIGTGIITGYGNNNAIIVVQLFGSQKPVVSSVTKNIATPKTQEKIETTKKVEQKTEPKVLAETTMIYDYAGVLQEIIYGVSFVVIGLLLIMFFSSFNFNIERKLVFRSVIVLGLLAISSLINKEAVILLTPHRPII